MTVRLIVLLLWAGCGFAQQPQPPSVTEKWHFFLDETFDPLTSLAGAFNASLSQVTESEPEYGVGGRSLAERFGAGLADIASQNFFQDFLMASVLHEDTRYVRRGDKYGGIWKRTGYALGSGFVTHTDSGRLTPNWANFLGTALSTALSNAYYPPRDRKLGPIASRYGMNVAGIGLGALLPEFWPDFHNLLLRHHLIPHRHGTAGTVQP